MGELGGAALKRPGYSLLVICRYQLSVIRTAGSDAARCDDSSENSSVMDARLHWSSPQRVTMTVPFMNRWRSQKYRNVPASFSTAE